MKKLFLVLFLSSTCSWASSGALQWKNVSIGASSFTPSDWKSSAFLDVAWTPLYDFGPFVARLGLGASGPQDANQKRFLSTYYQAAVIMPLFSFFGVEASFGYRSFHRDGLGSHPEWGGGFILRSGEFLDRVYVCMSRYLLPENTTSIFRVGIALSF